MQLGELCDKNKADVSRALAILEEKGLAVRESQNNSYYRAKIKLTAEGRAAAEQVQQIAERAVGIGGKGLTDEQRQIFYEALERITANLRQITLNGLD